MANKAYKTITERRDASELDPSAISSELLTDLRAKVDSLIAQYGPTARLVADWDYESVSFYIEYERQETDEERSKRLKKARTARENLKLARQKQEEAELKELERLQKKYANR